MTTNLLGSRRYFTASRTDFPSAGLAGTTHPTSHDRSARVVFAASHSTTRVEASLTHTLPRQLTPAQAIQSTGLACIASGQLSAPPAFTTIRITTSRAIGCPSHATILPLTEQCLPRRQPEPVAS